MEWCDMWKILAWKSGQDEEYQECIQKVNKREIAYLRIRNNLPIEQQEELEEYLTACQELGDCMTRLAFQLGREWK